MFSSWFLHLGVALAAVAGRAGIGAVRAGARRLIAAGADHLKVGQLHRRLALDRTEDAGPDRLAGIVDENGRVVVELDVRPVATAALLDRANDDGLDDRTFLHGAVRRSFLHRGGDDVAEPRVTAGGRSAQH